MLVLVWAVQHGLGGQVSVLQQPQQQAAVAVAVQALLHQADELVCLVLPRRVLL